MARYPTYRILGPALVLSGAILHFGIHLLNAPVLNGWSCKITNWPITSIETFPYSKNLLKKKYSFFSENENYCFLDIPLLNKNKFKFQKIIPIFLPNIDHMKKNLKSKILLFLVMLLSNW